MSERRPKFADPADGSSRNAPHKINNVNEHIPNEDEEEEEPLEIEDFSFVNAFEHSVEALERSLRQLSLGPSLLEVLLQRAAQQKADVSSLKTDSQASPPDWSNIFASVLLDMTQSATHNSGGDQQYRRSAPFDDFSSCGESGAAVVTLYGWRETFAGRCWDAVGRSKGSSSPAVPQESSLVGDITLVVCSAASGGAASSSEPPIATARIADEEMLVDKRALEWMFPLLYSTRSSSCCTIISSRDASDNRSVRVAPSGLLSVAGCALEGLIREDRKNEWHQVRGGASLPLSSSSQANKVCKALPTVFVPFAGSAEGSVGADHDGSRSLRDRLHCLRAPKNSCSGFILLRGLTRGADHTPLCQNVVSSLPSSSWFVRHHCEMIPACPNNCKFIGDAVDMLHLYVGVKSRLVPIRVVEASTFAIAAAAATQNDTDATPASRRQSNNTITTRSMARGACTWVSVEHCYRVAPSLRRCDWEDIVSSSRGEKSLHKTLNSKESGGSDRRARRAALGQGFAPSSNLNPLTSLQLYVSWPWMEAASVEDTAVRTSCDFFCNNPVDDSHAVSTPSRVLIGLNRRSAFELSHAAAELLREVGYPLACHMERITADHSQSDDPQTDLPAPTTNNQRVTPVTLAQLVLDVFGEDGDTSDGDCNDNLDCMQWWIDFCSARLRSRLKHFAVGDAAVATPHAAQETSSGFAPSCDKMGSSSSSSMTSHLFLRFAHACRFLEDPDDIHSLWIGVVDKLRSRIEHDPQNAAAWIHRVLPASAVARLSTHAAVDVEAPVVLQKMSVVCCAAFRERTLRTAALNMRRSSVGDFDVELRVLGEDNTGGTSGRRKDSGWDDDEELLFSCSENSDTQSPSAAGSVPENDKDVVVTVDGDGTPSHHNAEVSVPPFSLLLSGRPAVFPPCLLPPLVTRDQLEAQEKELLRLGTSSSAHTTRQWLMSRQLLEDMQLFLHANALIQPNPANTATNVDRHVSHGDVTFADFVRWHSPKDFVVADSRIADHVAQFRDAYLSGTLSEEDYCGPLLSRRMQKYAADSGENASLWWTLWVSARPVAPQYLEASRATSQECILVALQWMENEYTQEDLLLDVWEANIANALVPMAHALSVPCCSNPGAGGQRQLSTLQRYFCEQSRRIDRLLCRMEDTLFSSSEAHDEASGCFEDDGASSLRERIKAIVRIVEELESDSSLLFALKRLLQQEESSPGDHQSGAEPRQDSNRVVTMAMHEMIDRSRQVTKQRSSNRRGAAALLVDCTELRWTREILPRWRRLGLVPTYTSGADGSDDMFSVPWRNSEGCVALQWIQAHLLCRAERPIGRIPPLLQHMHVLWDWSATDEVPGGSEGSGGVSVVPSCRARRVWSTGSDHLRPLLVVRASVSEECS